MKLSQFINRSSKGKAAEELACVHLKQNGLKLIEKNFYSRFGEIDLIMQHGDALVFIEVRYRKNQSFGGAKASITHSKQSKIRKTALYYMQKKGREFNARFDVLAITGEDKSLTYEWIQNAF
ncbi:MAG TPA: YraN family protein [Gammaproteobacteria bacterium]|nr:YraN family protein [Gammaproteobacteria bacterium]